MECIVCYLTKEKPETGLLPNTWYALGSFPSETDAIVYEKELKNQGYETKLVWEWL